MKLKHLIEEFFRYLLVGGSAFAVDITLLFLFKNYVFYHLAETGIYISTALGFMGGLIFNYVFCLFFVFRSARERNKGKTVGAFVVFGLIGLAGLLLTEAGMYVGVDLLALNYLFVKVFVAGLVLVWNYGVRKIMIFR
jgi:putative flippase GtrA